MEESILGFYLFLPHPATYATFKKAASTIIYVGIT
jgi:hypothetical protein